MRKFAITLICAVAMHAAAQSSAVDVEVDLAKSEGVYKPIYSWFGYDEANFTTMKYGRQLLTELRALSPAPVYLCVHHLFTSGGGVPDLKWSSGETKYQAMESPEAQTHLWEYYTDLGKHCGIQAVRNGGSKKIKCVEGFQSVYPQIVSELS